MSSRVSPLLTTVAATLAGLLVLVAFAHGQVAPLLQMPATAAESGPKAPAQARPQPTRPSVGSVRPSARRGPWTGQLFAELDWTSFAAANSFKAVLGSSAGAGFGGGGRLTHRSGLFGQVDASRFKKEGQRAFVFRGEVFRLGIPTTIVMTPLELSGGYEIRPRSAQPGAAPPRTPTRRVPLRSAGPSRYVPYVGAGLGWVTYTETARFATSGDDVDKRFQSLRVLGGLDVTVWRMLGLGVDLQKRWVRGALGDSGVSQAFGETDLGGVSLRARFTVGLGR